MRKFQPDGWHTVTPRIVTRDVDNLIEFLRSVFNAHGEVRTNGPTEMTIGDSIIMVSDGGGVRALSAAFLYVYVDDADATFGRAINAGAQSIEPPVDTPYGDRRATIRDRWGNTWQIATHKKAPEEET